MYYKKPCLVVFFILYLGSCLLAQKAITIKAVADTQLVKKYINNARQQSSVGSDSALYFAKLARDVSIKIKWTIGVANSYMEVGLYYNAKGNFEQSLKNFTEALRLHDSIKCNHGMSYATNSIGNMYFGWGNFQKALDNYLKSYEIAEKDSNKYMMCVSLFGIANIYEVTEQYDNALKCYSKTLYFIQTVPRCKDFLAAYYINISNILNALNKPKLAILNLNKALLVLEPTNDLYAIGDTYKSLGISYSNLNIEDSAFYYFAKSEKILLENGDLNAIQGLYLEISNSYKKKNKYEKAFSYFIKHSSYKDSIFSVSKAKQILEIEKLSENRQIKAKINKISSELNESNTLVEQKKHENKVIYVFLTILILCLVFIGVLLYRNYKTNLILKQKNIEKSVLVQEIHHRVKNNLQFVNSIINMQINASNNTSELYNLNDTSRRISAMALVHEMLYNVDYMNGINIKQYIQKLIITITEFVNTSKHPIKFNLVCEDIVFDTTKSIAIGMIISELISNSIKYAFNTTEIPKIDITLKKTGDIVTLVVNDNGSGMVLETKNTETLGMRLIDIFTRQLKGDGKFENNNGLTFSLEFII